MDIHKFCVAGINYKKAEAELRGLFAINNDQYAAILTSATSAGLKELLVLSTCNRTEIYGITDNENELINLLCSKTSGNAEVFKQAVYIKKGKAAVEHIFNVGAGLDSQLLGDYEIVGQLKAAAKFSKQHNFLGAYLERLVNAVLQASKIIKNKTQLSSGTVSVAFAAAQYIRKNIQDISARKILLIGVGKIGSNTCKNLVDYLGTKNITLINRSYDKATELAAKLQLKAAPIDELSNEITAADIILVATNAPQPVVLFSHLKPDQKKLIIDLSIPNNVEEPVRSLPDITMVNVDELSKLKDDTLKKRIAEIPKAKAIITEVMQELMEWHELRKNVPILKELKLKLKEIHSASFFVQNSLLPEQDVDIKIQQVLNETAGKIKKADRKGCDYIAAINEFICTS